MTATIFGPIATEDGATMWVNEIVHRAPGDRLLVEQRRRYGTLRADQFDLHQPSRVPLDLAHDGDQLGELVYLERYERLTAVAVLDLDPDDLAAFGPLKLSTVTATDRSTGSVQLRSVGVVKAENAAAVGLSPVQAIDGDIRGGALRLLGIGQVPGVLARAAEWCSHRQWGDPLTIADVRPVESRSYTNERPFVRPSARYVTLPDGSTGELEYSSPHFGPVTVR